MAKKTDRLAARSEQLAQAVVEILAADGRGALTRERISEVAGLSRPLIYYYFNSAEAVMASAFKWICERILEREQKVLEGGGAGDIDRLGDAFVPHGEAERRLYRAFFSLLPEAVIKEDLKVEAIRVHSRRRDLLAELLLDAVHAGEVRPPDGCDLDAISGLLEGAALRASIAPVGDPPRSTIGDAIRRYLRPLRAAAVAA